MNFAKFLKNLFHKTSVNDYFCPVICFEQFFFKETEAVSRRCSVNRLFLKFTGKHMRSNFVFNKVTVLKPPARFCGHQTLLGKRLILP